MADYKLSELNSIDTIRSDDLLHVRVKKRPEMLGDEDRRMTYQDFLASFKLERFVQIAGSTMTGDLGIVKLLYGGKAVFDPTGSSEVTIGDVLKTFKINANGLRLTIADASRSATVYHTLNKPSPNELGMRTNEENDARYARLAVTNSFQAKQSVVANGEQLTLKTPAGASEAYSAIVGRNANNDKTWAVGNLTQGSLDVHLENSRGSRITLGAIVSVNKALAITGQVKPSDWSNLDARYFTQTAANQRFAQLTTNNTFTGANTFRDMRVISNSAAVTLQCASANESFYLLGKDYQGGNSWFIGRGSSGTEVTLYNYVSDTSLVLSETARFNKSVEITGQVQPSNWTNIDSRYVPSSLTRVLARTDLTNTFTKAQIISTSNGNLFRLQTTVQDSELYMSAHNADGNRRWWLGIGGAGQTTVALTNDVTKKSINLGTNLDVNTHVNIVGQVRPSDFSNLDDRYYTQSAANSRYMLAGYTGGASEADGSDGVAWNAKTGLYTVSNAAKTYTYLVYNMFSGDGSTPSAQLKFQFQNGGMWYRTSRDAHGFEDNWSKVYTEAQKPKPSDIGAYSKAETDQKIAQAISDSTDLNKIYPVGIVTWFNSNVDPNTALPGLTWTYLNNGVGRTIRIAAANGSDVATTGGSDSVTLAVGNLPSHTHSFSATTSSFDYGTKGTNSTGGHTHSGSGSTSTNGEHTHYIEAWNGTGRGGDKMSSYAVSYRTGGSYTNAAGNHSHTFSFGTSGAGDHSHSVGIGAHSHTVSGNTGGTGSGSAFSVTNQFYKLMAWVRTA
ncbi:tail fiber protein [Escherichia phage REP10]|uniref:Tail fiber protein n=1 Tax=Escherichia phage REP8 TaxID=3022461 RepID=A0AAF0B0H5_9CAUD|nr:tail fiber protein [Escherichia phage REP8]WBY53926.1 tail fiber protein [Escherichia phage REP9]WBY53978.1 tail fiber protein [Escherichia phage REP10]WBY54107.1 tail fiber protein [Escherichia phage REP11]WBY54244.1 tail fiber protein [Escherichia phage REP12]